MYIYTVCIGDMYDYEDEQNTTNDPVTAIEWAMSGREVAVLDGRDYSYLGYIQ